jgi:hypothetical protein
MSLTPPLFSPRSALKTLAEVVLQEKGPMPVGEIGKMLQEATANPALSGVLKETFGGLKKFLEKFPAVFLISQDHPFNPHVYLRAGFTEEEQALIAIGSTDFLGHKSKKKARRKGRGGGAGAESPAPSSDNMPSRDVMALRGGEGGRPLSDRSLKAGASTFVPTTRRSVGQG